MNLACEVMKATVSHDEVGQQGKQILTKMKDNGKILCLLTQMQKLFTRTYRAAQWE